MSLQEEWARCRPWIEKALAHSGTHEIKDVEEAIAECRMHFWPGKYCALITEFAIFPNHKVLNVFVGFGDGARAAFEIMRMEEAVKAFAREFGCSKLTLLVPPEAVKAVKRRGFTHRYSEMSKDI